MFVAADGIHCSAQHRLGVLAVNIHDENNEVVVAWLWFQHKKQESSKWFLDNIVLYLSSFQRQNTLIIYDFLKAIAYTVENITTSVIHSYFAKHLRNNVMDTLEKLVANKFGAWVYSKTKSVFFTLWMEVWMINEAAADYTDRISLLDRDASMKSQYGYITSNI